MAKNELVKWLNDAYAMEHTQMKILQNHIKDTKEFPAICDRLKQHLEETNNQARRLEECITALGDKPSTAKSTQGSFMGIIQGASTGMYKDELVKNAVMDFAAEYFEIATYLAISELAERQGEEAVVRMCRETVVEEQAMADFLRDSLPSIVEKYAAAAVPEASTAQPAFGERIDNEDL